MKIVSVQVVKTSKEEFPQIFGLGDDTKMYQWNYNTCKFTIFGKKQD